MKRADSKFGVGAAWIARRGLFFGSSLIGTGTRRAAPNARDNTMRFVRVVIAILLVGGGLLWLPVTDRAGQSTTVIEAVFTAIAAFSGSFPVVDTYDHWNPAGQIVILILIQAGGLGFMVGASLILTILRYGSGSSLRDAVVIRDGSPALTLRDARLISRGIVKYTFLIEALGAVVLGLHFWRDMPFLTALWHGLFISVSAFCNAGFDLNGGFRSLGADQGSYAVNLTVIALVQLGSISFLVLHDLQRARRWSKCAIDTRIILIGNAVLLSAGAVIFFIGEWAGLLAGKAMHARILISFFQSASARSAGFQTVDLSQANDGTLFAFTGLMFIGGAPGSTAGGIKITVAAVILLSVIATLRGESDVSMMSRQLPFAVISRALAITVTMGIALFALALALTTTEHLWGNSPSFVHILFDSSSALGSVGLSTGIIPTMSDAGKVVLCTAMVFGKLGPLTLAYALQQRQRTRRYALPEANIRMG